MRVFIWLALLTTVGVVSWFLFSSAEKKKSTANTPESAPVSGVIAFGPSPDLQENRSVRVLEIANLAEELHLPERDVSEDLEVINSLIQHYLQIYQHVPPGGLNEEITAAILGKNEKRLALISPKHAAISKTGELIDRYGSPYYFHPISRSHLEVRSLGPDKKLFTQDDVLAE